MTSIILDVFDDQLKEQRLTKMADCADLLDAQLKQLRRPVLVKVPPPKKDDADDHAKAQYKLFDQRRRTLQKAEMDKGLVALKAEALALPRPKRTIKPKR